MRRIVMLTVLLMTVYLCVFISSALAQDIGEPDTCRLTSNTWIINSQADSLITVDLWGWIDDPLIRGCSFGFRVYTYGSVGYGPHVDSLIIVDTFLFDPGMTAPVQNYSRSLLDESIDPDAPDWGYNGFSIGLVDFANPIFPTNVPTKIGEVTLKVIDRERVPEEFTIEIDSLFFPPAGAFKYSPSGSTGYPPQFVKSVIDVHNDLTPALTSIDPNNAKQDENVTVTIDGYRTHFGEGAQTEVFMTRNASTITAVGQTISTPTHMTADFSIPADAETGDYDFTVSVAGFDPVTEVDGFTISPPFLCGDASGDEKVNILDVVYLLNFIFSHGPSPTPYASGDLNCDGIVDIDDVVYLIAYIFMGGTSPCDVDGDGIFDC